MGRVLDYSLGEHSPYSADIPDVVRGYLPGRLRLSLLSWHQRLQEQARVEKLGLAAASDVPPPRPVLDKATVHTAEWYVFVLSGHVMAAHGQISTG